MPFYRNSQIMTREQLVLFCVGGGDGYILFFDQDYIILRGFECCTVDILRKYQMISEFLNT